jgi:hypothetical protein
MFGKALQRAVALGFRQVALSARADRSPQHLEALADSGLVVAAAALGEDLPGGCDLDVPDIGSRRRALDIVRLQLSDAARLGATCAWLSPGTDAGSTALACFADACALLADFASRRMVRLCITHAAGSALPTAGQALTWVEQMPPSIGLLLDAGRLAPGEDASAIIRRAGQRLGGVIVGQVSNLPFDRQVENLPHEFRGVLLVRPEGEAS